MAEEKIKANMNPAEMIAAMAQGNFGAANVLQRMFPKDLLLILRLDSKEVYGHKIWMLYKDCANENYDEFVKILKEKLGCKTFEQVYKEITGKEPRI